MSLAELHSTTLWKSGSSAQQLVHVQHDVCDASVLVWHNHDQTLH